MKLLCEVQDVTRIVLGSYTTIDKQFRVSLTVKGASLKHLKKYSGVGAVVRLVLEDRKRTTAALLLTLSCQATTIKHQLKTSSLRCAIHSFNESIKPIASSFKQVAHLRRPTKAVLD
jgi:hypothetical protein